MRTPVTVRWQIDSRCGGTRKDVALSTPLAMLPYAQITLPLPVVQPDDRFVALVPAGHAVMRLARVLRDLPVELIGQLSARPKRCCPWPLFGSLLLPCEVRMKGDPRHLRA
ncbi:hypothetical protein ACH4SP_05155 [Streptomyces sp. NPDC021093]|uniref:hypothetical protein n=1 Tax=Streptomyces sp. NPDC021093 TaxID=3365112 RepID=UPI00378A7DA8